MSSIVAVGIDAGSTTCKLAAVDTAGELVTSRMEPAQPRIELQVGDMLEEFYSDRGLLARLPTVATGYGRKLVSAANRQVTEITCHARGVFHELQQAGTLVDIGGQDSKVIRIGDDGRPAPSPNPPGNSATKWAESP